MRRVVCLLVVAVAWPGAAQARNTKPCGQRGRSTVVANAQARVYVASVDELDRDIFGCQYRTRTATRLFNESSDGPSGYDIATSFRLAGTRAAFARVSNYGDHFDFGTSTVDLRDGRTVRQGPGHDGFLYALEIARSGSYAYTWSSSEESAVQGTFVVKVEARGATTIATGDDIDVDSLAVAGGRVYWTQGGSARSAPIR